MELIKINKILNAIKIFLYQHPIYCFYYKKLNVKKNIVLLESTHGKTFQGHLFYLLKVLDQDYPDLKVYIVAQEVQNTKKFLENCHLSQVNIVKHMSKRYLNLLASAEYLLNDTSFYSFFIKKPGQKYINFWHGTPLKTLGQDMENITDAANVQRNFYMTDKIIVSNAFLAHTLSNSHGLNGIYQGKMVIGPSPRNAILLNSNKRNDIRQNLGVSEKNVSFYLPTWRGQINNVTSDCDQILADLQYLSTHLAEGHVLYVKLHPFTQNIDLKEFDNVHEMPFEYELYEFLTAIDVLVTDYSSVMYDFILANRKIILYTYDKDEYFSGRGVYDDIDRYPFVQVDNIHDLLMEIQKSEINTDYSKMVNEFCPVDNINAPQIICNYIFKDESHQTIKESNLINGKETSFVLGGGFWDNGVTTALLNTFDNIDLDKRNYVVLLGQKQLKKEHEFRVRNLSDKIIFYPYPESLNAGILDRFLYLAYMRFKWFDHSWLRKRISLIVKNDYKRITGGLKIDHFVHFTGFGNRYSELIKHVPVEVNTVMYVHTDMVAEYKAKKNFSKKIIFSAYKQVDKVAIVHENLKSGLIQEVPTIRDKLYVMNNFLGEERIRELAKADLIETLNDVKMEHGIKESLISDLHCENISTFINIGRFDYQKGHERLIEAFEAVYQENKNTRLVIVAPHGPLRTETLAKIANSPATVAIYVLGRMSNPYALLAKCGCFVLSSHYEGLGLVVYEALAVGISVVTVDLKETTAYLQNDEAIITHNSVRGIEEGMRKYLLGSLMNTFDFSVPKEKSKLEFERLFDEHITL